MDAKVFRHLNIITTNSIIYIDHVLRDINQIIIETQMH